MQSPRTPVLAPQKSQHAVLAQSQASLTISSRSPVVLASKPPAPPQSQYGIAIRNKEPSFQELHVKALPVVALIGCPDVHVLVNSAGCVDNAGPYHY
jgi:hypothetical protein